MFTKGLRPIAITWKKWYGTWGDPRPAQQLITEWLASREDYVLRDEVIAEHHLLRITTPPGSTTGDGE
jgi:hypothetical protein